MIAAISLEAPSLPLLAQLISDNRMPHLGSLQREGEVVDLTPPFVDGSVYAALYTGQHLSEHGIYSLFTWSAPEQRLRLSYDLMPPLFTDPPVTRKPEPTGQLRLGLLADFAWWPNRQSCTPLRQLIRIGPGGHRQH